MVAGLTADVFVQLTATLAHLSSTINRTKNLASNDDFGGFGKTGISSPADSLPVRKRLFPVGSNASIACPQVDEEKFITSLEWFCFGCGGKSGATKVSRVVGFGHPESVFRPPSNRIRLDSVAYRLQFLPVRAADEGDFFCLVNDRQKPTRLTRILIKDVPDPPGRPLVNSFTSRSVNLSWAPPLRDGHARILYYLIQKKEGERGKWQEKYAQTKENETVFQVQDLTPFSTYSFRVLAVNGMGRSEPSDESYYTVTLRAVPSGRPVITSALNASAHSALIVWRPPDQKTIHGEHLGYRLSYRRHHLNARRTEEDVREISIDDPEATRHEIKGLQAFTRYLVSVQVVNPEGLGPAATVEVTTDEGVPSMPTSVVAVAVESSSVDLRWLRPKHPNGRILGYRIYFTKLSNNFTDVVTARMANSSLEYTLTGLDPYTKYKMWLKAFTWKHEGESSIPALSLVTDVGAPAAPRGANLTCLGATSALLAWASPTKVFHSIDAYFIRLEEMSGLRRNPRTIRLEPHTREFRERKLLLSNLTSKALYRVSIRGATVSLYNPNRIYQGPETPVQQIHLRDNCDQVQAFTVLEDKDNSPVLDLGTGAIAVGAALAGMALILGAAALVMKRRFQQDSLYFVSDTAGASGAVDGANGHALSQLPNSDESNNGALATLRRKACIRPIPLGVFLGHVEALKSQNGFEAEFDALKKWEENENSTRNTYDRSRIRLMSKAEDDIDANLVDGVDRSGAYVATKCPSSSSLFWRMVWEQKCGVVVMMDNQETHSYWPSGVRCAENYGPMQVVLTDEAKRATHTIRKFTVRNTRVKCRKELDRIVFHYQLSVDRSTPSLPLLLLAFTRKVAARVNASGWPVLVHCCSGSVSGGVFIVLDSMLRMLESRGEVCPLGFLRFVRAQRRGLVRGPDEYALVHEALAEAAEAELSQTKPSGFESSLIRQLNSAVWTRPPGGFVFLPGFRSLSEFILTSHPTDSAGVTDFWRMVSEHRVQLVVVLTSIVQPNFVFWPSPQQDLIVLNCSSGANRVRLVDEAEMGLFQVKTLTVADLKVTLLFSSGWPPKDQRGISELLKTAAALGKRTSALATAAVVDASGGADGGAAFCALATLAAQIAHERSADIYTYVKLIHARLPGVWRDPSDLLFLYKSLESYAATETQSVEELNEF